SGPALSEAGLLAAQRISDATGARLLAPTQVPRMARGCGRPRVDRIPYVVDRAVEVLAGTKHVILVAAKPPTAFFAYPGKPSLVYPPDAKVHTLANVEEDVVHALEALADEVKGKGSRVEGKNGIGSRTTTAAAASGMTASFDPVA